MHVSEIWIYPVKSLGGVRMSRAEVCFAGFRYDRQWMLVDSDHVFLTQRQLPEMALIQVAMLEKGFFLSDRHTRRGVMIPFESGRNEPVQVLVWNDTVQATLVSKEADAWLSRFLRKEVSIVSMDGNIGGRTTRFRDIRETDVRFADDFPYHLTTRASLDQLNGRLDQGVEMMRFRPNIVVAGSAPFEEDEWQHITVGGIVFESVSRCKRCAMINVNPETGLKERQPLKALATFRRDGYQTYFGLNLVAMQEGVITEGAAVELSR